MRRPIGRHRVDNTASLWELLGLGSPEESGWMVDALCAQTDPEAFFPEQGESPRVGCSVCAVCPVEAECLAYALARPSLEGTWGGTSARERKAIRRRQARSAAADGVAA